MEAIIVGGQPPYSFQWSTGAYTKTISGLPAGTYTIFITDAAQDTISKSYTLIASEALTGSLKKSTYGGGYNVSAQGASDGWITAVIGGGAMPYSYQWSNGAESETNHDLSSGSYSVIVRDVNQCQLQLSANLTQPTPLHIVSITSPLHNGYNLSCKGSEDGAIDLTVSL
ncbi:MAG: SprB repeat-containing protein [Bacteroidia bacterium]|nr:SprB repeat-containing protein [Bacteroidia bacterium]